MEHASSINELKDELCRRDAQITDLSERNGFLGHLLEMASDAMLMIGKDGRVTYVNRSFVDVFSCRRADIIGSHVSDSRWLFRSADGNSPSDESVFQSVFRSRQELTDKICRLVTADGQDRNFVVNATIHHDDQGNLAGVAAVICDCTELNRVKAENQEIKAVYERLASYADEAIFRTDLQSGRVMYVNEAARRILGYDLEDYRNDPRIQAKVISLDHMENWAAAVNEKEADQNVLRNIILSCIASEGQTIILECTVIAVRNDSGVVDYFECIGRDITVRRFMEAELAKAQKLESIGLLAGGIAHDFNNIMTAVFGSLALAKMECAPESAAYTRLAAAEEQCMKAKTLTRKLLTYSRGGSPQRKTASIANVIRDAVNFSLSGKNVECRFQLPEGLWSAQIDEGQMHQVAHSLVTNACEAMPYGGMIEVGAANIELKTDQVAPLAAGRYIKWYVRDQGVGISNDHMKRIFDPYFTTKQMSSVKGMGLGLAICYSIVKNHEGMITVESTPGVGTVFTVYIPASNGEKDDEKPQAVPETPEVVKPNILLIDDEQILLDVTGSMLKHIGCDVVTAKSHVDAMEYYRQAKEAGRPFSVIIMDLTMRGDEGGEIAIRRWKDVHPEVKAVISSGYMNDPVIEEYWKYGFVGAMVKPYSLTELKSSLERILAGGGNERN